MRAGLTGVFKSDGGLTRGIIRTKISEPIRAAGGPSFATGYQIGPMLGVEVSDSGVGHCKISRHYFLGPEPWAPEESGGSSIRDFPPGEFAVVDDAVYILWRRLEDHQAVFEADFADLVCVHAGGV